MKAGLPRLRVAYKKGDRLAYLGHLEVLTTMERSIRRAGLPVSIGNGFARRMRVQFSQALESLWELVRACNKYVDSQAPWALFKQGDTDRLNTVMHTLLTAMRKVALCLWPFRQDIAALMTQDAATQAQIVAYLEFNLLSTPFSIASTVMGGVMNGAGATRYNLMIFGGGLWLVRLPLGWLLGHQLWGTASGIFAAMLVSQIVQAVCMLHVVLHCNWTRFAMHAHKFSAGGHHPATSAETKGQTA